ncbi:MAG: hypothetical protein HQL60_03335 [Magnetococcales bacterium]|nr:hypothetical protein [Magnetococcales bacterium]
MAIKSITILVSLLRRGVVWVRQQLLVLQRNPRLITDPTALQIGDYIHFGHLSQPLLNKNSFQVVAIDTVVLDSVRQSVLTLVGEEGPNCYLTVAESDHADAPVLRIGCYIADRHVGHLFDLDQLALLLEEQKELPHALKRRSELPMLPGWTADRYYQSIHAVSGIRHRGDFRNSAFMPLPVEGEGFDYYLLLSQDHSHAVAIEVNDEGHIALSLMVQLLPEAIERIERFSTTRKPLIRSFMPY